MKFCRPHWEALKQAIKDRGLYDQVATSGEEAAQRFANGTPDPLMDAYTRISFRAVDYVGMGLMMHLPDGTEPCPVCAVSALCGGACGKVNCGDDMIIGCADAILFERTTAKA